MTIEDDMTAALLEASAAGRAQAFEEALECCREAAREMRSHGRLRESDGADYCEMIIRALKKHPKP